MDIFTPRMSKEDLKEVNKCRLYIKDLTAADITTLDGKRITTEALNVTRTEDYNNNLLVWTNQHKPGNESIKIWRKALIAMQHKDRWL